MKRNTLLAAVVLAAAIAGSGCKLICEPDVPALTEQEGHLTYYFPPREEFGNLADGTYYGRIGCGDDVARVRITVQDNLITDSEILHLMVSQHILQLGLKDDLLTLGPDRFLAAQSPQFDAITGATGSTHCLKICYTRALWKAAGKTDPMKECVPFVCK
jgi:uncharacterized protein with FMN-binding domain